MNYQEVDFGVSAHSEAELDALIDIVKTAHGDAVISVHAPLFKRDPMTDDENDPGKVLYAHFASVRLPNGGDIPVGISAIDVWADGANLPTFGPRKEKSHEPQTF